MLVVLIRHLVARRLRAHPLAVLLFLSALLDDVDTGCLLGSTAIQLH